MRKLFSVIIVVFVLLFSCEKTNKLEKEIDAISMDVSIERFDQLFANTSPENLSKLKEEYLFMFSKRYNDSVWINRINDTLLQQLAIETKKKFNDFNEVKSEIESFFKHLKYYNKTFKSPRVIGYTDYVDYRNKIFVTDSIVLIALDTYLGSTHEFYQDIQRYLVQNFESSQIVSDLASEYAKQKIYQSKRKTFLDEMIYYGKEYYFKDVMIPFKTDAEKIGYTLDQINWAIANEYNIWTYFVENELLFDTDTKLVVKFINPAPFSKFGLELDNESPGRLGRYIGWQIVKSYMDNNEVSLEKLLTTEAEEIFNKAKFKPRK